MTGSPPPTEGISGSLEGESFSVNVVLIVFLSLTFYNSIELLTLIFSTFRRWTGLYFWSLFISGAGLIPYALGFILKYFLNISPEIGVGILTVGWYTMVTGQSFVLYSRLHLLLHSRKALRRILYLICTNVVILHFPTTVLTIGSNSPNPNPLWSKAYNIMEKIQMTGFTATEILLSSLYVFETVKLLRMDVHKHKEENRRIMFHLIAINIAIVLMDLTLLGCEYASEYAIQTCLKGAVYSIKLKLEFAVLGKLVDFLRSSHRTTHASSNKQFPAGQSSATVTPGRAAAARVDDPYFYGQSLADADACRSQFHSSDDQLNVPEGIILTKTEIQTRTDDRILLAQLES